MLLKNRHPVLRMHHRIKKNLTKLWKTQTWKNRHIAVNQNTNIRTTEVNFKLLTPQGLVHLSTREASHLSFSRHTITLRRFLIRLVLDLVSKSVCAPPHMATAMKSMEDHHREAHLTVTLRNPLRHQSWPLSIVTTRRSRVSSLPRISPLLPSERLTRTLDKSTSSRIELVRLKNLTDMSTTRPHLLVKKTSLTIPDMSQSVLREWSSTQKLSLHCL